MVESKKTQDTFKEIIGIVSKITRIDQSRISNEILIREELGIDSLMSIEIIANVEKHYNITIDESLMNKIETVGDFIALVESIVYKR
jgi:acyl carrier protein